MSNTYNVAGFSTKNGKTSFRVANGSAASRTKVLERDGHTNIDLIDLPSAMSKEDAFAFTSKAITVTGEVSNVAPKTSTVKSSVAKAPRTVKVTKTVAEVKEMFTPTPAPKPELTAEEQAMKDKNLQTMQEVSARLSKMRDYD